jgi:hypothetical protein
VVNALARYEPLDGLGPSKEVARHPSGAYVALETAHVSPQVGIWETATGVLLWAEPGTLFVQWALGGSVLLVVRENSTHARDKAGDERDGYDFERWSWPQGERDSKCAINLPFSAWPADLWVAPSASLVAVQWVDQGASGWEVVAQTGVGDRQLLGAGFELASELGTQTHPVLSPDERYAVSGYQTIYDSTPWGGEIPRAHGRFEVGRCVIIDIAAGTHHDLLIDDAVPLKLHGTAARWTDLPTFIDSEQFTLQLPTGAKRVYSVKA